MSLGLALLVNRARFAKTFFRSVFFLPTACSYVVASLIWKLSIFSGVRFGLMNTVLGWFGIDPIAWLSVTQPPWYWLVIVTARMWLQAGFYMILFLAGLQRISPSLYEAAAIDGADRLEGAAVHHPPAAPGDVDRSAASAADQRVPGLRRVLQPAVQLRQYPPYARPPLVYLYYAALGQGQDFGHGSAGAVILTLLIAVVALGQGRILGLGRRED